MAWFDTDWQNRKKITIDNTKVAATLTDFPVYIDLSDLTDLGSFKSDGSDIVVTSSDETTKLKREVVSIDTTGDTGELHVKVPSLSGSSDTEIYIYYNNSGASETDDTDTWNSNYKSVWHLGDGDSTATDFYKDSTSNAIHGTLTDSDGDSTNSAAQLGDGMDLAGDADYIDFGDNAAFDVGTGNFSIEGWVDDKDGGVARVFWKGDHTATDNGLNIWANAATLKYIQSTGLSKDFGSIASLSYVAAVREGTGSGQVKLYLNGTEATTGIDNRTLSNSQPFRIGANSSTGANPWQGLVDEVRFSDTDRSANWISTTYNNQNSSSTFYSVGSEEDAPATNVGFNVIMVN